MFEPLTDAGLSLQDSVSFLKACASVIGAVPDSSAKLAASRAAPAAVGEYSRKSLLMRREWLRFVLSCQLLLQTWADPTARAARGEHIQALPSVLDLSALPSGAHGGAQER